MSGVMPCSFSRCTTTELSTPPETNAAVSIVVGINGGVEWFIACWGGKFCSGAAWSEPEGDRGKLGKVFNIGRIAVGMKDRGGVLRWFADRCDMMRRKMKQNGARCVMGYEQLKMVKKGIKRFF